MCNTTYYSGRLLETLPQSYSKVQKIEIVTPVDYTTLFTLEQVKNELRVDFNTDDTDILQRINAAISWFHELTGKAVGVMTVKVYYSLLADETILPFTPIASITSITDMAGDPVDNVVLFGDQLMTDVNSENVIVEYQTATVNDFEINRILIDYIIASYNGQDTEELKSRVQKYNRNPWF